MYRMTDPYALIDAMAFNIIDEHRKKRPKEYAGYSGEGNEHCINDTKYHLSFLFDAASIESPQLFINYVAWAKVLMEHLGISDIIFREVLEHMWGECRKRLDGPFAMTVDGIMETTLDQYSDMPLSIPGFLDENERTGSLAKRYLELILSGKRREAQDLIRKGLEEGMDIHDMYLKVFQLSQYEIGRLWQHRKVSVAQEHMTTMVTQQILAQLYPQMLGSSTRKGSLVVTSVGNELHEMGARMVADFLELDGWDVNYLGSNTPHKDVIFITKDRQAKALLISATMGFNIKHVRDLISLVRAEPALEGLKVMVGGYPFNTVDGLWKKVGADSFARDADEAVNKMNEILE
jgi:methanogenic corrinoid protein MtbC1